jgi:hypothetical protein
MNSRKIFFALALIFAALLLAGCGVGFTMGPGSGCYNNQLTIVNSADCDIRVIVNGQELNVLTPGQYYDLKLWSGFANRYVSKSVVVTILAQRKGKVVSTYRTFYISTQPGTRSDTWLVRSYDLQ